MGDTAKIEQIGTNRHCLFLLIIPIALQFSPIKAFAVRREKKYYVRIKLVKTAFCIHDFPKRTSPCVVTGSFVYVRFHGAQQAYSSSYTDGELEIWARRLKEYSKTGRDVYIYFNNDIYGYAVENAKTLKHLLGENE